SGRARGLRAPPEPRARCTGGNASLFAATSGARTSAAFRGARGSPRLAARPRVAMRSLILLGSTGSIGRQTLDLLRAEPGRHRVVGLAASRSQELLRRQVEEFRPAFVALTDPEAAAAIAPTLPAST